MSALSDHVRRDADAASLAEINLLLGQYRRRGHEVAKTTNKQTLESVPEGTTVPFGYGIKVGRLSALQALKEYISELDDDINRAIAALEAGPSSD